MEICHDFILKGNLKGFGVFINLPFGHPWFKGFHSECGWSEIGAIFVPWPVIGSYRVIYRVSGGSAPGYYLKYHLGNTALEPCYVMYHTITFPTIANYHVGKSNH